MLCIYHRMPWLVVFYGILQIQQMTDANTESIEEILQAKSKDLLKIS